jgi:PAS domain-containing protein
MRSRCTLEFYTQTRRLSLHDRDAYQLRVVPSVKPERPLTFVARAAQEQLRHSEAAKQASILDALPACIALLDSRGLITSVNQAWRQFARANAMQEPGYGVGVDYPETCKRARGEGTSHAHQAARGIRSVSKTEEQSRLLRLLNCDEFQGYLFSKPVPREIFETRFLARPGQAGI